MFGRVPNLFGKNFITSFLFSAALFVTASCYIFLTFLSPQELIAFILNQDILKYSTYLTVISLFFAVFLQIANGEIIRIMEGYGILNPFKLVAWVEIRRFRKLYEEIRKVKKECRENKNNLSVALRQKRNKLMMLKINRFPDEERWLLPTSFGNTMRAFEVYSRLMYGADAILLWIRLLAVIPEEYLKFIESAKAQLDIWVSFWFLSILLIVEYLGLVVYTKEITSFWIFFILICITFFSFSRARFAAKNWGEFIKASFDLYLPSLKEQLKLDQITDDALWSKYSQAIIYAIPSKLPKETNEN
ncbi:MAG: hypothetical protein AAGF83_10750 [Cyanobacteria bacterium P01_G01_bin.67]